MATVRMTALLILFVLSDADPLFPADPRGPFPIPAITSIPADESVFSYSPATVPFYPASKQWGTMGEPFIQMQDPLSPEVSRTRFVTPTGFEVRLFAAEPEITKPICMCWDERGRLWVAETVDYPNDRRPPGSGRDRIKICEDTDDDGRADKFTVFADKLSIPTSIAIAFGGLIVHQAPDTLFLKDTDGDDIADVRNVLFTGWSTRDTHAGPSNLQYGHDNWFWGMQGYAGFEGEIAGELRRFNRGFYRFRLTAADTRIPQVAEFEFMRSTDNNSWGIGFSEEGLVFGSTANRNPSVFAPIANRFYEMVNGWSVGPLQPIAVSHYFQPITTKIRQVDHHAGYTAAAGHALYTARNYPREYWNRTAFVCGPTGHLIGTFVLTRHGSDMKSSNSFNLLASDDEWSAPIMAEVGPDGNVWFIDWYNYIVQHNPTPAGYETGSGNAYVSNLRDKRHGRVYRIVPTSRADDEPVTTKRLAGAAPAELVETLRHTNLFWRRYAQQRLVESANTDVVHELIALVNDTAVDSIGLNCAAIHGLWTLHGLGVVNTKHPAALAAAINAIRHPSAGVRRTALSVLPRTLSSVQSILDTGALQDSDAMVKLSGLLAIAEMPTDQRAGEAVAAALREYTDDPNLLDAATAAGARHDDYFLAGILRQTKLSDAALRRVTIVAEHLARSDRREKAKEIVSLAATAEPNIAAAIVQGLSKGWPATPGLPLSDEQDRKLVGFLQVLAPRSRGSLAKLADRWGSRQILDHTDALADTLLALVGDTNQAAGERIAAAGQLVAFRGEHDDTIARLVELVNPRMPPATAAAIIDKLLDCTSANLGRLLVDRLGELTPTANAASVRVLLARPKSTRELLSAVERGHCTLDDLSLEQKQALARHPDNSIGERAKRLLAQSRDLPNPDRQKVLDSLRDVVTRRGDPSLGKTVYLKHCAKCHVHQGEGTRIGPDLTGMAVHTKLELLTHLIDPSRSVEGNFRIYSIVTDDGRILSGLLASETNRSLELFDSQANRQTLLRADIDELVVSSKSLMPDGFEKEVSVVELVNLLEFLTQRVDRP